MEFGKRTRRIMKNYMVWAKKNDKDIEGFGEEDRKNLKTLICFYIEFKSMKKKEWEKVSKKDKVYIQSLQVFDQYIHQKKLNKFIEESNKAFTRSLVGNTFSLDRSGRGTSLFPSYDVACVILSIRFSLNNLKSFRSRQ